MPNTLTASLVSDICEKFVARSRALATDGFIVYDIQNEAGRTAEPRPFPFMKMLDPAEYGALLQRRSGKGAVIYKCVVEADHATFDNWLDDAVSRHDHRCFNLVGGASSSVNYTGPTMPDAAEKVLARAAAFGCVTIAERHAKKGTEHTALLRKTEMGAQWFISQVGTRDNGVGKDGEAVVGAQRLISQEHARDGRGRANGFLATAGSPRICRASLRAPQLRCWRARALLGPCRCAAAAHASANTRTRRGSNAHGAPRTLPAPWPATPAAVPLGAGHL
jgi:hypothetical protein